MKWKTLYVSGATLTKNEAKITITGIPDKPGSAAKIFQELAKSKINVDVIIQNVSSNGLADVTFTVLKDDLSFALETTERIKNEINATGIIADDKIAKLSIVGIGMRSHCGIAEELFRALADEEINIKMISTSEIKISCVIDEDHAEKGLRAIHRAFKLDQEDTVKT
ncbi:MAG: ACT domain-containing protein [Candidatus Scalindua sp.]|nr:ACT domain-containing protein [Candidatus Scalindua sp.]